MLFTAALSLLGLGSSLVTASPLSDGAGAPALVRACGSTPSDEFVAKAEAHFAQNRVDGTRINAAVTLDVYCTMDLLSFLRSGVDTGCLTGHVIYKNTEVSGGYIPDSQISNSIKVLNEDYASCGVSFRLAGTDRTLNADWFDKIGPKMCVTPPTYSPLLRTAAQICVRSDGQTAMKEALRKGGAADLNVYSVGKITGPKGPLLGYAPFPWSYSGNPKNDGAVILSSSVPGGTGAPFNMGRTLTHETGYAFVFLRWRWELITKSPIRHWVGLYHTFQGDKKCDEVGDHVSDTPTEAGPVYGCPDSSDTCPGEGTDP